MRSFSSLPPRFLLRGSAIALAVCLPLRVVAALQADPALDHGRHLTTWLLDGRTDSLYSQMAPAFRTSIGGRSGLAKVLEQVGDLGPEAGTPDEVVYRENGSVSYYRIGRFEALPSGTIHWIWDSAGTIQGLLVRPTPPEAPSKFAERPTRASLRLPFDGAAYVAWGGRAAHENYHVESADQRFAYDFFPAGCPGTPILAPARGTVRAALDTVADNAPGRMNALIPPGNHVIIDHGRGEFSVLAHLRRGSVRVRRGQRVEAGEPLGACGNSGNSSAPHLHYHLQTESRAGAGAGLPAQFHDYRVDDGEVRTGEPVRGQMVEAAP